MRPAQLYQSLQYRRDIGALPLLEELEWSLTHEQMEKVIRCMNAAFDAGEVEFAKRQPAA